MPLSKDYMFTPPYLAMRSNTSLMLVLTSQADTPVVVPPILLLTSLTLTPRLSIMTQLTQLAYNFNEHNYAAWASGFELLCETHSLLYHLMDDRLPLHDPSYASWS